MDKLGVSIIMPSLNEERNVLAAITDTLRAIDEFEKYYLNI